jgi:hypothetical protein
VAARGKEHKRTLSAAQAIRYPEITVKKISCILVIFLQ